YCKGKDIVKKGRRKKKFETVQLYYCNNCKKVFTPQKVKGKQFPLSIILDGLSLYNTGWTLEESCKLLKEKYGLEVKPSTLSDWVKEFQPLCRYSRMREFGLKLFSANQVIQSVKLFHRQVFEFKYHRAKIALILQEFKHTRFEPLREFLDLISVECPHQLFRDGARMSELKPGFDLSEVIFRKKHNFACRIAELVLQAVADNKLRHKAIQDFMIANDSVSVACEVPVYLKEEDVEHMQKELGFVIPDIFSTPTGEKISAITGHIDILQIRNGAIHILDYKPDAEKHRPIEQLTLYAIALSRLTGLRLYEFKCGWFDNESYFEFFPLHVIYKLRKKQKEENPAQCKLPLVGGTTNGIQI
ncbi:MAG: PD-(D/E)XK nuclease family protein, partial [Endomicrobia bacterium]|nr:PD-(D/E)XK nuclease family protein [Endomicrobiia bacterium]